jgi:hypothetical protein
MRGRWSSGGSPAAALAGPRKGGANRPPGATAGLNLHALPGRGKARAIYSPSNDAFTRNRSARSMAQLFLHIGVFAVITALVATACFWLVGFDERQKARRQAPRR